jgi:hypothetical protein
MSRYIATRAIRGANLIVAEAEAMLQQAIAELGPDKPVAFTNTAYYLPVILAFTGHQVAKLGDMVPIIAEAKNYLHPVPGDKLWLPYLGETLDCGMATLLAEEIIEGVRFARAWNRKRLPGMVATSPAPALPLPTCRVRLASASMAPLTTFSCAPGASNWWTVVCLALPPSPAAPRATK